MSAKTNITESHIQEWKETIRDVELDLADCPALYSAEGQRDKKRLFCMPDSCKYTD